MNKKYWLIEDPEKNKRELFEEDLDGDMDVEILASWQEGRWEKKSPVEIGSYASPDRFSLVWKEISPEEVALILFEEE